MILKIGNVGLIRNPEMVFLNDFKRLLEPYVKCEFFDVKEFKDVVSKERAKEIIQDNLTNGTPLNNIALEIYLDDEYIEIEGSGTYEIDCINFKGGFNAIKNMDKLLEPFSEYLSYSKSEPFKVSFINENYKNSLEQIIANSKSYELYKLPVEKRLLTILYGIRFKSSFLDFLLYELIDAVSEEKVFFYEDEKYNEYLSKLIYGLKNRGVFFSHEREIKQNNFVQ